MASVGFKPIKWFRMRSTWEQAQAWRERRKEVRERLDNLNAQANAAFNSAWSNQISGQGQLAAEAAAKRVYAELQAKIQQKKLDLSV
jgi:hypothetical protein